jgi:hypothetical protein
MSQVLKIKFPTDVHNIIKLYTGEACWRNGKFIHIHHIPKNDPRYAMLLKRPKIKQIRNDHFDSPVKGAVWFKSSTGKFVFITVRYGFSFTNLGHITTFVWEMDYDQKKTARFI